MTVLNTLTPMQAYNAALDEMEKYHSERALIFKTNVPRCTEHEQALLVVAGLRKMAPAILKGLLA